jgi:hypothetical protein
MAPHLTHLTLRPALSAPTFSNWLQEVQVNVILDINSSAFLLKGGGEKPACPLHFDVQGELKGK